MKSEDYPFNSNSKLLQKSPGHIYQGAAQGESGDEENTDFVRPSGRLAARMLEMEDISQHGNDQSKGMSTIRTTESTSFGSPTEDSNAINDSPLSNRKGRICLPRLCTPRLRKASVSPGLFGSSSPRRPCTAADNESDSDELPANQPANDRLKALVEKKRQERLAGERGAAAEKAKKIAAQIQQNAMLDEDEDISDDNIENRLAQQARSTKKASRKAQEEILRETQRMSRNMQLTHKPITKKKITKASLFAKFNYKTMDLPDESLTELRSSSSAAPHSDIEMRETPPTSPASRHSESQKPNLAVTGLMPSAEARQAIEEEDFRDLHDAFKCLPSSPSRLLKKGKGEAIGEALPELPPKPSFKQRPIGVQPPRMTGKDYGHGDSDSDLEIVSANTPNVKATALNSLFNRVPAKQAKESSSLHALRILAHLTASDTQKVRKETKLSMTTSELQLSLQQRARQQAACEREDRLRALRDKGVIIQTAEEREREMAEVEDLISKARREGKQIMRIERAAAKRERRAHVDVDTLENSSDDEDWEKTENPAEEISGSEEEDKNVDEDDEMTLDFAESVGTTISNPMFDDEASKTDEAEHDPLLEEEMAEADEHRAEDEKEDLPAQYLQRSRKTHVLSDEEEDQCQVEDTPSARRTKVPHLLQSDSPGAPTPVLRSATKSFIPGLPVAGPAGLRLTQIFAGTLDESQIDASPTARDSKPREADHYDLVAHLRGCSEPELPDFVSTMSKNTTVDIVMDSQSGLGHVPESQNGDSRTLPMQLQFTPSQIHGFDSPALDPPATQICDMPEPTQDSGFQHMTPIRARFEAPSPKVDKELLAPARESESVEATPVAKKKGKLRRRAPQVALLSDEYEAVEYDEAEAEDLNINANVFDVMRKASKKKDITVEEFDKTKSVAKDMVHEQAEESEDEYAGLGGASDDESGEDDAFVKEIIDDEGRDDVDEHQLAAFFA
jgi:mediator of replication checkpoint protein 1